MENNKAELFSDMVPCLCNIESPQKGSVYTTNTLDIYIHIQCKWIGKKAE